MTDNTLPEVGSRWMYRNSLVAVDRLAKRGRGWQVLVKAENTLVIPLRLADFRKQAKPA